MTELRTYTASEVASIVRNALLVWAATAIIFCVVPSALLFASVPRFEALFKGFGADLPAITAFILRWPYLLWVAPAAIALLLFVAMTRSAEQAIASHRLMIAAIAVTCCISMAVQGLAMAAMYAPILQLGAVV